MSERTFTREQLLEFDGSDDKPAYVAYQGKVYDVTKGPTWVDGEHLGHAAGVDLTEDLEDAPHGDELLEDMPVVGKFIG